MMLEDVLRHINNWFFVGAYDGTYTITDGSIELPFLHSGQYYRIMGSIFNDGLHKAGDTDLTDETFSGVVWVLAIPKAVVDLAAEIASWQEKNKDAVLSPYTSESFGGYSYSKASVGGSNGASAVSWQTMFRSRLNDWRKIKGVTP